VLPNGIDPAPFSRHDPAVRARARAEFGFDAETFVIGAVGSLTPIKRFELLIDALAEVRRRHANVKLLLVGDGPLRTALAIHAKERQVAAQVHLAGSRDDVPFLLRVMDAYVCSSDSEGMSNSLLEAMASGLPVVTTDVGDHGLAVRDGIDGFVVRPGDSTAFADRIARWVADPELRSRHGAAAGDRITDFDFAETVRTYERFYTSLLRRPCAPLARRGETRVASPRWSPRGAESTIVR
jgi:glycosyltransferase involved in cell wall biosynthesis